MTHSSSRATLFGLLAIVLWSTSVGLMRSISEALGPTGGAALLYSISAFCLCLSHGLPTWRIGRNGLICGLLFVAYEISLALAIGLAHTRNQALEMGMINYLWPGLTLLFSLFLNHQRSHWVIVPGLILALLGVFQVMQGDAPWTPAALLRNMTDNPLAYGLAFSAAIIWALYCNLTRRWSDGQNMIPLFFCMTALVLWVKFSASPQPPMILSTAALMEVGFMGISTAVAYAAWNYGLQYGNLPLLATASYFTPVLSALVATLWLGLTPAWSFWQGVGMVVCGSLLCWWATHQPTVFRSTA